MPEENEDITGKAVEKKLRNGELEEQNKVRVTEDEVLLVKDVKGPIQLKKRITLSELGARKQKRPRNKI